MIIEFAGLPGSGKSTVAAHLQEVLAEGGQRPLDGAAMARNPGWFFVRRLRAVARRKRFMGTILRFVWRSPRPLADRWLVLRTMAVSLQRYDQARLIGASRAVIFAEGMVQRGFLVLVEADGVGSETDVGRFLRRIPRPDVLVLIEVDPSTCLERVALRKRGMPGRLSGLSTEAVTERLTQAETMLNQLSRGLISEGSIEVIRIDGTAHDAVGQVLSALESRFLIGPG